MAGKLRRLTAVEVEALLSKHGFHLVSEVGSHRKGRHEDKRKQVIVPMHKGRPLPIGTLRFILGAAEVPEGEWRS
jgi:predicted RNA binding protein YcfA (HicA-like mRNA interferase family)